jgi:hypothetical protein
MRVTENSVMRIPGHQRKLHSNKLHNLHPSSNISLGWSIQRGGGHDEEHMQYTRGKKNAHKILVGKSEIKVQLKLQGYY